MRITSLTLGIAAAFVTIAPLALQEKPVPVSKEPHHHLRISNDDERVYYVEVAPHTSTLVHEHDLDYFYVTLSNSPDLTNRVVGKPEQHLSQVNGDMHYSRGGFAHSISNDGDTVFHNVTVVLLKPQGEPRNLCAKILPDKPLHCDSVVTHAEAGSIPQFATDQLEVSLDQIVPGQTRDFPSESFRRLLVPLEGSSLVFSDAASKTTPIDGGHVVDVPPGSTARLKNAGKEPARVYVAAFHGATNTK